MKMPFVFLLSILALPIFAQNNSMKSLEILAGQFQYEKIIQISDSLLRLDSTDAGLYAIKGRAHTSIFQYSEALECYKSALTLDSNNISYLGELANAYRNTGDLASSAFAWYAASRREPENSFFLLKLAEVSAFQDDFISALRIYNHLLNKDSANEYLLKQAASCYNQVGLYDSAAYCYLRVIARDSMDLASVSKLANIYVISRQYEKGLALTENFRKRDSTNAGINKQNAYFCYLLKKYDLAQKQFYACYYAGDSVKFVCKYLGLSCYRQEIYDTAEYFFSKAYNQDSTDAETCFYYGISCIRSAREKEGFAILDKMESILDPYTTMVFNACAEHAFAKNIRKDFTAALEYLKRARAIKPNDPLILFRLGYQYDYWLKDEAQALPLYQDFINQPNADKYADFYILASDRVHEIEKKISNKK
jgi:tetratricopeptide (TPR) repeat protein